MTFAEAVTELWAKHPKADLSPSVKTGKAFARAYERSLQEASAKERK